MTPHLDIRGSGGTYAIFQGKTRISRFYPHNNAAVAAIRGVEARLAPVTVRACLHCGTRFNSTGRGHRMCKPCREGV